MSAAEQTKPPEHSATVTKIVGPKLTQAAIDEAEAEGAHRLVINGTAKEPVMIGGTAEEKAAFRKKHHKTGRLRGALRSVKEQFTSKDGLKSFVAGAAVMGGVKYAARSTTALAGLSGPVGAFAAGALGAGGLTVWDMSKEGYVVYKDAGGTKALSSVFNRASLAKHGKKFCLRTLTGTAGALTIVGADAIMDGIEEAGGAKEYFSEKLDALKAVEPSSWLSSSDWFPSSEAIEAAGEQVTEKTDWFTGWISDLFAPFKEFLAKLGFGSAAPDIEKPEVSDPLMGEIIRDIPQPDLAPANTLEPGLINEPLPIDETRVDDIPAITEAEAEAETPVVLLQEASAEMDAAPEAVIEPLSAEAARIDDIPAVVEIAKTEIPAVALEEAQIETDAASEIAVEPPSMTEQIAALDVSEIGETPEKVERLEYIHEFAVDGDAWALSEMADTLVYDEETRALAFEMYTQAAQSPIAEVADHAKRNLAYLAGLYTDHVTDEVQRLADQAPPLPEAAPELKITPEPQTTSYAQLETSQGQSMLVSEFTPKSLAEAQFEAAKTEQIKEALLAKGLNPEQCDIVIHENTLKSFVACNENAHMPQLEEPRLVVGQN